VVNRPQIAADGFAPYVNAITETFDRDVDFAQLIKIYQATPRNEAALRPAPAYARDQGCTWREHRARRLR